MFRSRVREAQPASVPAIPVLDQSSGNRRLTEENRRPTVPRPAVRCDLFNGWGPKL